ncbi:MAG: hypothetical protein KC443_10590 [Anaerolineales bacterium]|nr:hypothetical protein [Anaerolineales bacterium]
MKESESKEIEVIKSKSALAKILEMPINTRASIEIAVDRANAEARIKIIEADLIVKHGLLHTKKR